MDSTLIIILAIALVCGLFLIKQCEGRRPPIILVIIAMTTGLGIYYIFGSPTYRDQPHKMVQAQKDALQNLTTEELLDKFTKNLEVNDTPQARLLIGNIMVRLGRLDEALTHFKQAYIMDQNNNPDITMNYVEILIASDKNTVTNEAKKLLDHVLKENSENPKALFYTGLYFAQNQKQDDAKSIWKKLVTLSNGQPWQMTAIDNLRQVTQEYNISLAELGVHPALIDNRKITRDDLDMIANMVKQLKQKAEANPNDKALQERLNQVTKEFERIKKGMD